MVNAILLLVVCSSCLGILVGGEESSVKYDSKENVLARQITTSETKDSIQSNGIEFVSSKRNIVMHMPVNSEHTANNNSLRESLMKITTLPRFPELYIRFHKEFIDLSKNHKLIKQEQKETTVIELDSTSGKDFGDYSKDPSEHISVRSDSTSVKEFGDYSKDPSEAISVRSVSTSDQELGDYRKNPIEVLSVRSYLTSGRDFGDYSKDPSEAITVRSDSTSAKEFGDHSKDPREVISIRSDSTFGKVFGGYSKDPSEPISVRSNKAELKSTVNDNSLDYNKETTEETTPEYDLFEVELNDAIQQNELIPDDAEGSSLTEKPVESSPSKDTLTVSDDIVISAVILKRLHFFKIILSSELNFKMQILKFVVMITFLVVGALSFIAFLTYFIEVKKQQVSYMKLKTAP